MKTVQTIAAALLLATSGLAMSQQVIPAQEPKLGADGIGRHEAIRRDIDGGKREAIQVRVDFAPGASFPMHNHPGEEIAYVLSGTIEYTLENQAAPVTLKAGEAIFIPAGVYHSAHNTGNVLVSELATYTVEKGKPVLTKKQP